MTYVPFTPAAVKRIREGATADDLGWSTTMYQRVCRERGIDPLAAPKLKVVPAEEVPVSQEEVEKPEPAPEPEPPKQQMRKSRERDVLRFDRRTGELFYHDIVVAFNAIQAKVFEALFDKHVADHSAFITASEVCDLTLIEEVSTVEVALRQINNRLVRLGLRIEGRRSAGGGYRLRIGAYAGSRYDSPNEAATQ